MYEKDILRTVRDRAKLFRTGGSQAVRLPKKYRFEGTDEVWIRREGASVILEPAPREWTRAFLDVAGSCPDFPPPAPDPPPEAGPELD